MSGRIPPLLMSSLALAVVAAVDYFFIPGHVPSAVLYAVPVLLAIRLLEDRPAFAFTVAAIALDVFEDWVDRTPSEVWIIGGVTLALIGWLAVGLRRQTRRSTEIAEENRRLYDEVRREAQQLERVEEERKSFIALVNHELRGILTVLSGHVQMLGREGLQKGLRERSLQALASQIQRMTRLLGDLSDVSSIERGQFNVEKGPCDLVAQARHSVADYQGISERHRLILDSDVDCLEGRWDCDRLRQVLDNLIRNAIKYSPRGGEVRVTIRATPEAAELAVSDEGIGISEEDLPTLFRPYSRAVQEGRFEGLGLGLYITRRIVEAHGGRISAERRDGRGTTFRVMLPLQNA